ncbi:M48 family metallopeptidase [Acetobacter sp. AN02]|uniref:M48 family metallopeptidase n=1 Tax=Acetobacter sp. AN02 TaxID=2894186 RepID=UPI00243451F3|nr:SprT family zinc-dependent metalloprotease [Acetobacter sp. AN02]MDG6094728.1 M48 family metallopeptidase [Acetobacter sp. AN02]
MAGPETELIPLAGSSVPVRWHVSDRARRISMRPDPQNVGILITLPRGRPRPDGLRLLTEHAAWVRRVLASTQPALRFLPGETFTLDGSPVRIVARPDARGGAGLDGNTLWVSGRSEFHTRRIMTFLRALAGRSLPARTREQATRTGLVPARIDIRDPAGRWGSCSAERRLMLSWRLILAPVHVRDYVIMHELAHLKHLNHSPAFWTLVDLITPDRRRAEHWLKTEGRSLMNAGRGAAAMTDNGA